MANKTKVATGYEVTTATSVPDAIEKLNKRLSDLKHIAESVYKTPGKVSTSSGQKDIKEETNVTELVKCLSGILARAEAQEKAYDALGMTKYPVVKVDGGTVEEWISDIKLRIEIIEQKDTFDKLNGIKKRWEELMDKEDRKALLIKEMENL